MSTIAKVAPAAVVDAAGALVALLLPDGPGYYAIRRFTQRRTAGAASANYTPALYDQNAATSENLAFPHANVGSAVSTFWPALSADPPPARYAYCPAGLLYWDIGANVAGDTWQCALIVEKLR